MSSLRKAGCLATLTLTTAILTAQEPEDVKIREIEQSFLATEEWQLVHSFDQLSPDVREQVLRRAGAGGVAQLGDPLGQGDIRTDLPRTQFLYAAINERLAVFSAYHDMGFNGTRLLMILSDRATRDSCEYSFSADGMIPSIPTLRSVIEAPGAFPTTPACRFRSQGSR